MTQREIIYDIREKLKLNSDDIDITDEYLAHLVDTKRSLLISQRYTKFSKPIPEEFKQTLCLELEEVDIIENSCFKSELRTVLKLPSYMENYLSIRTMDLKTIPFNLISEERVAYLGYNRWTDNQLYAIIDENRLTFYSKDEALKLMTNVKFTSIFTSPEQANELTCEKDITCDFLDAKYPIIPSIASDIVTMIIRDLAPTLSIQDDKINNADESPR